MFAKPPDKCMRKNRRVACENKSRRIIPAYLPIFLSSMELEFDPDCQVQLKVNKKIQTEIPKFDPGNRKNRKFYVSVLPLVFHLA